MQFMNIMDLIINIKILNIKKNDLSSVLKWQRPFQTISHIIITWVNANDIFFSYL